MGLKTPKEKNPTRVVLVQQEYRALLTVSRQVDWRFHVALVLAHETGHRIGDIRKLRWSDIDFEGETVRWRAEHDKAGYEHRTPLTPEALSALEEARRENPESGDAPILPAPKDPSACMSSALAYGWWSRAARFAGLEAKPGRGWHSLRRKFASDFMDQPLKVLCQLGGWKTAKTGAPVLSESRRGSVEEGAREPPRSRLKPICGSRLAGIRPTTRVSSILTTDSPLGSVCQPGASPLSVLGRLYPRTASVL